MNYDEGATGSYSRINPIVIIGVVICCVPVVGNIFQFSMPGWLYGLGIMMIVIGAIISAVTS